ncbi:hypothetical protein ACFQO7_03535 [Catellatospora aurea]|uniref:Uncharacterized protein n=1 Tax=Catellatospora aurea TaxID=1337874 RepID=A0ABW2GNC4_9ACTN
MTYDTRAQFSHGLVDSDDDNRPPRHDGVPHQDRTDDVVDGELVDGEPAHRHDQDGVVSAEEAARDGDPVEPVDLDGFGGTTEGRHDVATPDDGETPALEDTADTEPAATDDPAHPEAHIGEDPDERFDPVVPADEVQDETVAQAVNADDEPADTETRTLDDLADVEVPADDALDDEAVARDDTPDDEPTPADQAVEDLTTPGATVDESAVAELTGADDPDQPEATADENPAADDAVVVGGADAVDPPAAEPADVGALVAAASLWPAAAAEDLRDRWQAAQLRFVDDPPAVAAELRDLVGEAVRTLQESLADRQRELDDAFGDAGADTEQLRLAVQRYRDFHQQLLER